MWCQCLESARSGHDLCSRCTRGFPKWAESRHCCALDERQQCAESGLCKVVVAVSARATWPTLYRPSCQAQLRTGPSSFTTFMPSAATLMQRSRDPRTAFLQADARPRDAAASDAASCPTGPDVQVKTYRSLLPDVSSVRYVAPATDALIDSQFLIMAVFRKW